MGCPSDAKRREHLPSIGQGGPLQQSMRSLKQLGPVEPHLTRIRCRSAGDEVWSSGSSLRQRSLQEGGEYLPLSDIVEGAEGMQADSRGREPGEADCKARRPRYSNGRQGRCVGGGTIALSSCPLTPTPAM